MKNSANFLFIFSTLFVVLCLFEENIWSMEEKRDREGKKENIWRKKIFVPWRRMITEKENEENI